MLWRCGAAAVVVRRQSRTSRAVVDLFELTGDEADMLTVDRSEESRVDFTLPCRRTYVSTLCYISNTKLPSNHKKRVYIQRST